MNKYNKLNLILIVVLGLGLIYSISVINSLDRRVDKLDNTVIDVNVSIRNGTGFSANIVHLTRGATAMEALRRVSTVDSSLYPAKGEFINSIDGVSNNITANKFWLIGYKNPESDEWKSMKVSASKFKLEEGQNILFWYGKPSNSPFNIK